MKTFPDCYASATARGCTAAIFTRAGSFNVLDATAPGMTPKLSLERAEYMAMAAMKHSALVDALRDLLADARAMDARLLVGQPNPGCEKGSISRAEKILFSP